MRLVHNNYAKESLVFPLFLSYFVFITKSVNLINKGNTLPELILKNNCEVITQAIQLITNFNCTQVKNDYTEKSLSYILSKSTKAELKALCDTLEVENYAKTTIYDIEKELYEVAGHSVSNVLRIFTTSITSVDYSEILDDIFQKLSIEPIFTNYGEREVKLLEFLGTKKLEGLNDEDKAAFLSELGSENNQGTLLTAAGGLTLANLSGFGVYTAATGLVGGITSAVGVTLPFAAYTGLTSAISVMTGPIGWGVLTSAAIYKLGQPNFKKTIPAIAIIGLIRLRLKSEFEENEIKLKNKIDDFKILLNEKVA